MPAGVPENRVWRWLFGFPGPWFEFSPPFEKQDEIIGLPHQRFGCGLDFIDDGVSGTHGGRIDQGRWDGKDSGARGGFPITIGLKPGDSTIIRIADRHRWLRPG